MVGTIATILVGAVDAIQAAVADCTLPNELARPVAFAMDFMI